MWLQHALESQVRATQCVQCHGLPPSSSVAFSSHYEIFDDSFHKYVLTTDESASREFICEVLLCPFCGEVKSSFGFCCSKYEEYAQFSNETRQKASGGMSNAQSGSGKNEKGTAKSGANRGKNQRKNNNKESSKDSRSNNSDARRLAKEHSEQRYLHSVSFSSLNSCSMYHQSFLCVSRCSNDGLKRLFAIAKSWIRMKCEMSY